MLDMNIEIRPWAVIMLLVGIGVALSKSIPRQQRAEQEEIRLLPELAMLGGSEAQFKLGVRYEEGEGFPKSDVRAYAYYALAASTHEGARNRLDDLEKRLPPGLIATGKDLAAELQREIQAGIKERNARIRLDREWKEMAERNSKK